MLYPITETQYTGKPESWWLGKTLITLEELRNGWGILPKGSKVIVKRKYKGFNIESLPCTCCGLRVTMSYVSAFCLAVLEQE